SPLRRQSPAQEIFLEEVVAPANLKDPLTYRPGRIELLPMRRPTGISPRRQLLGILLVGLVATWLAYSAVLAQPAPAAAENGVAVSAAAPNVISLWGGARESIALKSDGTVWSWGLNN